MFPVRRVLCLGNELLADDALGHAVAQELRELGIDAAYTPESGLNLLDHLLNTSSVLVVDAVLTGSAAPGTVYVLREEDFPTTSGPCLHYLGLFDAVRLGRRLGLFVPEEIVLIAVEAADCSTVSGSMTPAVEATVPVVVKFCLDWIRSGRSPTPAARSEQS